MMKPLLLTLLIFKSSLCYGLSELDVVRSSLEHYPLVIETFKLMEASDNEVKAAQGNFDLKIKGEADVRSEGYYQGDSYKAQIVKPLAALNSNIYAGKRQGFGNFPDYEGKYETLNQGELFAGVSVSLLRDSLIDSNRFNLWMSKENLKQAKYQVDLIKINVQTMAMMAYWNWFIKGQELIVYQEILDLSLKRGDQIHTRTRRGDLAKIYQVENEQYIVKREANLTKVQAEFAELSYYLSLFYRNKDGNPIVVGQEDIPTFSDFALSSHSIGEDIYEKAVSKNIDLKQLESQKEQAKLEKKLGQNEVLPRLDVNFEWNQDQGVGPNRLMQDENRILLSLEVPLQFRKGLGKKRSAQAKIEQLETKQKWMKEKLNAELNSLVQKMNANIKVYQLTKKQVELSKKMVDAEQKRFKKGASDLILVNLREENLAEAQISNLSSILSYNLLKSELLKQQVEFLIGGRK